MSTINKIEVSGVTYDIEDSTARSQSGLTNEAKQALLACFQKVAWIDANGQTYYDALEAALYPPANLDYISAVYTQSGTVYESSSLNSLKSDLVVTAHYSDNTTETVSNYVLSGTLTIGTSTITVTYGGKTTTFSVTVSSAVVATLTNSDFDIVIMKNESPYYQYNLTTRFAHVAFDIPCSAGTTYEITTDWNHDYDLYVGASAYEEDVMEKVAQSQNITTVDDSGWQRMSAVNGVFTFTTTYNSRIRFNCKIGSGGSTSFTQGITYINSLTVARVND